MKRILLNQIKKLFLILIVLGLFIPTYSQNYEKVVKVDSTNKRTLYERSLRWFVHNAKNSNYVIKLKDADKGEVYAKLSFETPKFKVKGGMNDMVSVMNRYIGYKGKVDISVQILSKDNRYKYLIVLNNVEIVEKLEGSAYARMKKTKNIQNEVINKYVNDYINSIIENIIKHMSRKSDFESNEW